MGIHEYIRIHTSVMRIHTEAYELHTGCKRMWQEDTTRVWADMRTDAKFEARMTLIQLLGVRFHV